MTHQWTSAVLGIGIAAIIFLLIRRDHLHTHHAGWWLLVAFCIALLGIFPRLADIIAGYLKVSYPPTLMLVLGLGLILVKVLSIDIHQSRQERRIRRLTQRLALLEEELSRYREISPQENPPAVGSEESQK